MIGGDLMVLENMPAIFMIYIMKLQNLVENLKEMNMMIAAMVKITAVF